MTCVDHGWVPWATNTTPGRFDEQWLQKRGLKGALVVVVEANAVGACFIGSETVQKECDQGNILSSLGATSVAPFFLPEFNVK